MSKKAQFSLKPDENNVRALYKKDQCPFLTISRSLLLRMRNVSHTQVVDEINTHILRSVTSVFLLENRAVCEIMWESTAERGTS